MLILIGVVPGVFAVNPSLGGDALASFTSTGKAAQAIIDSHIPVGMRGAQSVVASTSGVPPLSTADPNSKLSAYLKASGKLDGTWAALAATNQQLEKTVSSVPSLGALPGNARKELRSEAYLVGSSLAKLQTQHVIADPNANKQLSGYRKLLDRVTNFIPVWVKIAVAICLGLGTMIGWKRIVVTVGERIGKAHLTYAQGASAETVAWATIQAADIFGLPVSTTHVLSSGVAGTMAANGSGVQGATIRNIALAWLLTLPVCVFLGSMLFAGGLLLLAKIGVH
jgi:PiT family inorganic phosphate transporter